MKKIIQYIINNAKFLFMPHYWILNNSYSYIWDMKLNILLKKSKFTNIIRYTAYLGKTKIWIANHPYASFTPYHPNTTNYGRPSRHTIHNAKKQLKQLNDI